MIYRYADPVHRGQNVREPVFHLGKTVGVPSYLSKGTKNQENVK